MTDKKQDIKDQPEKPIEQLTFTEEEHRSLVEYMNFVSDYARFSDVDIKKMHQFSVVNVKAINVVKKIEAHIFEFKKKWGGKEEAK